MANSANPPNEQAQHLFSRVYVEDVARREQSMSTDIYKKVMKICNGTLSQSVAGGLKLSYAGGKQLLQTAAGSDNASKSFVSNRGLSAELGKMLQSEEFYDAVEDCYPGSYDLQVAFISSLVTDDVAAKILTGLGAYYAVAGIYSFFGLVGDLMGLAAKSRKIIRWTFISLGTINTSVSLLQAHYKKKQEDKKAEQVDAAYKQWRNANVADIDQTIRDDENTLKMPNLTPQVRAELEQEIADENALKQKALQPLSRPSP